MARKTVFDKLSDWLATEKGKVVVNYFYGFGAALVILGALFKIMHYPGAATMLVIGMGTEVLLFVVGAFEKPQADPHAAPQNIIPSYGMPSVGITPEINEKLQESVTMLNQSAHELRKAAVLTSNLDTYVQSINSIADDARKMKESTATISSVSANMAEHYSGMGTYAQSIKKNNQIYDERMNQLNDSIGGLNNVYLEQMRTIITQIESISKLHNELVITESHFKGSAEETSKFKAESTHLVAQLSELNGIYSKMISAMSK